MRKEDLENLTLTEHVNGRKGTGKQRVTLLTMEEGELGEKNRESLLRAIKDVVESYYR